MTLWQVVKNGYRGGWAYMLACPLLFMVPVLFELIQHIGEMHIGMYDSVAAAKAVEHHPLRMGLGMLKMLALTIPIYWVTRFLAFGNDAAAAKKYDAKAVWLFALYCVFEMVTGSISLYASTLSPLVMGIEFIVSLIVFALFLIWGTASTLGNDQIGPVASAKIIGVHALWAGLFAFLVILPLMIPHYALGAAALLVKAGPLVTWAIHLVDSLVVGLLNAIMLSIAYFLSRYFADRKGISLMAP